MHTPNDPLLNGTAHYHGGLTAAECLILKKFILHIDGEASLVVSLLL